MTQSCELKFWQVLLCFKALFELVGQVHLQDVFETVLGQDNFDTFLSRPESYGFFSQGYSREEGL